MYKIRFKNVMRLLLFDLLLFPSIGIVSQNNAGRFHDTKLTFDSKYLPTLKPDIIKELETVYSISEYVKLKNESTHYYTGNSRFSLHYEYPINSLDNISNTCKFIEPDTSLPYKFKIKDYPQLYGMLNLVSKSLIIFMADDNELLLKFEFRNNKTSWFYKEDSLKITTYQNCNSVILSGQDTIYHSTDWGTTILFPEKWRNRVIYSPLHEFKKYQSIFTTQNTTYSLTLGNITTKKIIDHSKDKFYKDLYEISINGSITKLYRNLNKWYESIAALKKEHFPEIKFREEMVIDPSFLVKDEYHNEYTGSFIEIKENICINYKIYSKHYYDVLIPKDDKLIKRMEIIKLLDPYKYQTWNSYISEKIIEPDVIYKNIPLWKIDSTLKFYSNSIIKTFMDSNCYLSLLIDSILLKSNLKNSKIYIHDKMRHEFSNGINNCNYMIFRKINEGFELVYFYQNSLVPNTSYVQNHTETIKRANYNRENETKTTVFQFQGFYIDVSFINYKNTKYKIGKINNFLLDSILVKHHSQIKRAYRLHFYSNNKFTVVAVKHKDYGWMLYKNNKPIKGITTNMICTDFIMDKARYSSEVTKYLSLKNRKDSIRVHYWKRESGDYGIDSILPNKTICHNYQLLADSQIIETKIIQTKNNTHTNYIYKNKPFTGEIWHYNIPVLTNKSNQYGTTTYTNNFTADDVKRYLIQKNSRQHIVNNNVKLNKYHRTYIETKEIGVQSLTVDLNKIFEAKFAYIQTYQDGKLVGSKTYNILKQEIYTEFNPDTSLGYIKYWRYIDADFHKFESNYDFYAYFNYIENIRYRDSTLLKRSDSFKVISTEKTTTKDSWEIHYAKLYNEKGKLLHRYEILNQINGATSKIKTFAVINGKIEDSALMVFNGSQYFGNLIFHSYSSGEYNILNFRQEDSVIQNCILSYSKDTVELIKDKTKNLTLATLKNMIEKDRFKDWGYFNYKSYCYAMSPINRKRIIYFTNRRAYFLENEMCTQFNYPIGKTYFHIDSNYMCAKCYSTWQYDKKEKKNKIVLTDVKYFNYAFFYPNGKTMGKTVFYESIESLNTAVDCMDTIFPVARYPLEFSEFYNEQGIKTFDGKNGSVILKDNYGQLMYEKHYKNGQLDSVSKTFSGSGKLTEIGNYKNGKKHGVWLGGDLSLEFDWAKLCGETLEKIKLYQSRMNLMIEAEEYVEGKLIQSKLLQFNIEK